MAADYAQISATLVAYLAPFTPFLMEGGKQFAGEMGKEAWEKSRELWEKIKSRFSDDKGITDAVKAVAINPESESFKLLLAKALAAKLKEAPDFADELLQGIGGESAIQKVIAEKGSWVDYVTQEIVGRGGTQSVEADDGSVIKGVSQSIKRNIQR